MHKISVNSTSYTAQCCTYRISQFPDDCEADTAIRVTLVRPDHMSGAAVIRIVPQTRLHHSAALIGIYQVSLGERAAGIRMERRRRGGWWGCREAERPRLKCV